MRNVETRIEQIAKQLGNAACTCKERDRETAIVVIKDGWGPEEIELAEAAAQFDCPTHGRRKPVVLHLLGSDVHG